MKRYWKYGTSVLLLVIVGAVAVVGFTSSKPAKDTEKAPVAASKKEAPGQTELANTLPGLEADVPTVTREELDAAFAEHVQSLGKLPELDGVDEPIRMTYYFIRALQLQNEKAVLSMLTEDALAERLSRNIPLGPDYLRETDVDLGNVQYLQDEQGNPVGAHVGTTWLLPDPENKDEKYQEQIAWVFRKEADTWRVAGMIAVLDPKYPPILVNFENIDETLKQYQSIEAEIEERVGKQVEATPEPQK
ncbi:MAG: hypothetical protein Q4D98_14040 [Planctomycetia bacterium]|nr:hypothetical protein [Planctomycetia bacterium]